jgi:hypothetical protein
VGSIFRFCRISTWDPLAKPVAMSVTYVRWSKVLKRLNLVIRLPDSNVKASSTSLTSTSWLLTLVFIILILLKTLWLLILFSEIIASQIESTSASGCRNLRVIVSRAIYSNSFWRDVSSFLACCVTIFMWIR